MAAAQHATWRCWACGTQTSVHVDVRTACCRYCGATLEQTPSYREVSPALRALRWLPPSAVACFVVADAVIGVRCLLPLALAALPGAWAPLLRVCSALLPASVLAQFACAILAQRVAARSLSTSPATPVGPGQCTGLRWCTICAVVKQPCTKHCRFCDACFAERDHHCPWLNSCVSALTLRPFVLFLLSAAGGSSLALAVCAVVWRSRRSDLLAAAYAYNAAHVRRLSPHGVSWAMLLHLLQGTHHSLLGAGAPAWLLPLSAMALLNAAVLVFIVYVLLSTMSRFCQQHGQYRGWTRCWRAVMGDATLWATMLPRIAPPAGSHAAELLVCSQGKYA